MPQKRTRRPGAITSRREPPRASSCWRPVGRQGALSLSEWSANSVPFRRQAAAVYEVNDSMKESPAEVLYEDDRITCTHSAVVIRGYYFPFATAKTVPYRDIRRLDDPERVKAIIEQHLAG